MRWLFAPLIAIIILGVSMSLHDVDKNNSSRITPLINSADDVQQRMAQGTNGVQNTNDLEEVDGLQFRERQIVAVQDGENKAAFGFYGTANKFGLKVAQDGYDVLTAANDELIFNSENNTFKIYDVQTVSYTVTSGSGSVAIEPPEDAPSRPIIVAFDGSSGGTFPAFYAESSGTHAGKVSRYDNIDVFGSTWVFSTTCPNYGPGANSLYNTPFTVYVKYYVLIETAG